MTAADSNQIRLVSRQLSGYLCGTHSGVMAASHSRRTLEAKHAESISARHRRIAPTAAAEEFELGTTPWRVEEQTLLGQRLEKALKAPGIIDLIFYGSQARGDRTGFSDVDAILVVSDNAADDPGLLRTLRPRVLAAQRAVLSYQPLQHHAFEVGTPRLLRNANVALNLPGATLTDTQSLNGTSVAAGLADSLLAAHPRLARAVNHLRQLASWPSHRWDVYFNLAMFELLPALYLQARGRSISKSASFAATRSEFGEAWWPYDELAVIRETWPRIRRHAFNALAEASRNPWAAAAAWRRLPAPIPDDVREMLTPRLLTALHSLADSMVERSR